MTVGAYTVSIMEFSGGKVARETQCLADPFEASARRAQWAQVMSEIEGKTDVTRTSRFGSD
jgi:hypothetical protein